MGGQQQRGVCAQEVTAGRAGTARTGVSPPQEAADSSSPPMKSFSKQTSTKILQSPQLQSKPRTPRKGEKLWRASGESRAGKWQLEFGKKGAWPGWGALLQPSRGLFPPRTAPVSLQCPQSLQDSSWSSLQLPQHNFSTKAKLHIFTISAVFCDTSTGDAQLSPQHTVQAWRRRGQSILKASRVLVAGPRRVFLSPRAVPAAGAQALRCQLSMHTACTPLPCSEALFWQLGLASQHLGSWVALSSADSHRFP